MCLCRSLLFVGGSPTTNISVVRASVAALLGRGISVASAAIASALVFAGIFVMRFSFYMMHMTVGISL